jgi:hypothetical protein
MSVTVLLAALAPSLAADPSASVFIEIATGQINRCFYGTQADYATALLTAHIMTMSKRGLTQGSGPVSSIKEGDLSISYGSLGNPNSVDSLLSTTFGALLYQLKKGAGAFVGVTGGNDNGCAASWPTEVFLPGVD